MKRSEKDLEIINENFRTYFANFEHLPYGVAVVENDSLCTVINANDTYYELIGHTKEELLEQYGNRVTEVMIDHVYHEIEERSAKEDYDIEWDLRLRASDDSIRWIHDFAHYNAKLNVFFMTITDITDKMIGASRNLSYEAYQTRHEILSYLSKYTSDHIVVVDAVTNEVVYINSTTMKAMNFHDESDWHGKSYSEIAYGLKEDPYLSFYELAREDEFISREYYNRFHDLYIHVEVKLLTIPALHRKMRLHIISDITARKKLEHKIAIQKTLHDCIESLYRTTATDRMAEVAYYDILNQLKNYYDADRVFIYKLKNKCFEVEHFYEVMSEGLEKTKHKLPMTLDKNQMQQIDSDLCTVVNDTHGTPVAFMGVANPKSNEDHKELMELLSQYIDMFIEHQNEKEEKEEEYKLEASSKANLIKKCGKNFLDLSSGKENIIDVLDALCDHYEADFAVIVSYTRATNSYGVSYVTGKKIPNLDSLAKQPNEIMERWADTFKKYSQYVTDTELDAPAAKEILKKEFGIYNFIVAPIKDNNEHITGLLFLNNFQLTNRSHFMVHIVGKNIADYLDRLKMQEKVELEPATKLANKIATQKQIAQLLEEEQQGTVFIIDIDNFKRLNDTLGHYIGDQALLDLANVLREVFKTTDIIGRIGGDEFMAFCPDVVSDELMNQIAMEILERSSRQYEKDGFSVNVSVSVGVCAVAHRCKTFQPLYENADYALYIAKRSGKNQYHIYSEAEYLNDTGVEEEMRFHPNVVKKLKTAIRDENFVVHYQPIYHVQSGTFTQAEALVRMAKNDGSLIFPNDFIKAANSTGLIVEMTYQILEQVCCDFRKLLDEQPDTTLKTISINVPYLQFTDPNMESRFKEILDRYSILPRQIKIEITERVIVADVDMMTEKMEHMIAQGFEFELDDFGTDYSNLQATLTLPMEIIKLDRSLLLSATASQENSRFFRHLLSGINSIGRKIVLEGVETNDQLNWALDSKCEYIQGFYYSRPVDFQRFSEFLREK